MAGRTLRTGPGRQGWQGANPRRPGLGVGDQPRLARHGDLAEKRDRLGIRSFPWPDAPFGSIVHSFPDPARPPELLMVDQTQRSPTELLQILHRRMAEQAALYEFTDRLFRASTRAEVYDAALDAIIRALGCSRASILLFDENGTMDFVAWRGLSETYRAAVTGHSPWKPGERNAEPVCVEDGEAADIPEPLKAALRREKIRGIGFIPLTVDGAVIGKFMTYYATPHRFEDEEIGLA